MKSLVVALLIPLLVLVAIVTYASTRPPSPFETARTQYEFLQKNGADHGQLCSAAERVRDAARDDNRSGDYRLWDITARLDCNEVNLDRL